MKSALNKKELYIYGVVFLSGVILLVWSGWRNFSCGYDCGLFSVTSGPVVIVSWIFSFVLIGGSSGLLFITFLWRKFNSGK